MTSLQSPDSDLPSRFAELGPWQTRFQIGDQTLGGAFHVPRDNPLQRKLLEFCALPQRVLELGCMEGGRTFPLARCSGQVVAVDGRREHLRRARFVADLLGIGNVTFLEMDLEAVDLATLGSFDAVFNAGLLYLLAEPWRLLRQSAEIAPAMLLLTHIADPDRELVTRGGYRGAVYPERVGDPIGGLRSHSFRPADRHELERMLAECGWTNHVLFREEGTALGYWCTTEAGGWRPEAGDWDLQCGCRTTASGLQSPVSVIVVCHNYARHLDDCLRSVFAQTRRPDEILVVDDDSTDETAAVIERWRMHGVKGLHVAHHNPRLSRNAGLEATSGEFVLFLDADDLLTPDYIRSGLERMREYDVGVVYSDMLLFGNQESVTKFPEESVDRTSSSSLKPQVSSLSTRDRLSRESFIHSAALARREALVGSGALDVPVDPSTAHEDWLCWRRVIETGWRAVKQPSLYYYRRHHGSASQKRIQGDTYYQLRALPHETITLFIPLSGRSSLWPQLASFLEQQTWPHAQVRLFLLDTSQDAEFGRAVRRWIAACDYPDVRYVAEAVGPPGLADQDRRQKQVGDAVRMAAARIYNRLARDAVTDFVWIVEDDILPPLDVADRLLRGFDAQTGSVAAPYPSRYHAGYVAWHAGREIIKEAGDCRRKAVANGPGIGASSSSSYSLQPSVCSLIEKRPEAGVRRPEGDASNTSSSSSLQSPACSLIEGNGFGCVMLRGEVLRQAVFTYAQGPYFDFDPMFYLRLKSTGLTAKLRWDCECRH